MKEYGTTGGARALLFERLVDEDPDQPEEEQPFRVLSRKKLWESVRREVGRLLNTRCPVPLHLITEEERTVINYGIPDFTSLSSNNAVDRQLIANIIGQTIAAYEPRLRNIRVSIADFDEHERKLWITIDADLVTDRVIEVRSYPEDSTSVEPVTFPIVLHNKTGMLELYENE
ncbi:MAG TPA: type VI secretion system baseplate subunit TssE [Pyrinomonadaceae bacterium]|jgi:type VI secretion system protein ImpF